jgi:hypothetical protein
MNLTNDPLLGYASIDDYVYETRKQRILRQIEIGDSFFISRIAKRPGRCSLQGILKNLITDNRVYLMEEAEGRKGGKAGVFQRYGLTFNREEIHTYTDYDS